MPGSARRRFTADFPSAGPVPPRNTASNSFVLKLLPITPMGRGICAQNPPNSMKTRNCGGRGYVQTGSVLTEQVLEPTLGAGDAGGFDAVGRAEFADGF